MHPQVTAHEIRIRICTEDKFHEYACRIARLIDWRGLLIEKHDGYRWMIGTSNDWWLDYGDVTSEIVIAYRYGSIEFMRSLFTVIVALLHLEHLNKGDLTGDECQDISPGFNMD